MFTCKFCGSHNIKTYSDSGDPFDRHPQVTVCGDCGRLLSSDGDIMDTMYAEALKQCSEEELAENLPISELKEEEKRYIRLEMHAHAMGVHCTEVLEIPFEDGEYKLWEMNYPLCRFGTFKIEGNTVAIDNEVSLLTRYPIKTEKHFTAYAPDKVAWPETIEITITEILK